MADTQALLEEPPHRLPERIVAEAERISGGPAALYVIDLGGEVMRRVVGSAGLPREVAVSQALGPELTPDAASALRAEIVESHDGAAVASLQVRGRATCVLVAAQGDSEELQALATAAAPAVEMAPGFTDVLDRARRERPATPAAEIQQDLLAPRLAAVTGASVAASVIPAYDVGGDWYDHAENPEGTWLGVADAMGRGLRAAAVSCVAIGALRAARRAGMSLEECCQSVDEAIDALSASTYVTLVLANWHAATRTLSWINCGHPPPLHISPSGQTTELEGEGTHPLGLWLERRSGFRRNQLRLDVGDRVMLFTDGVTDRRNREGEMVGLAGVREVIGGLGTTSAAETVLGVEHHLRTVSDEQLADDATQLVIEVCD